MLEQCQTKVFQSLSIEILCSHWQDLCLEVNFLSARSLHLELVLLPVARRRTKTLGERIGSSAQQRRRLARLHFEMDESFQPIIQKGRRRRVERRGYSRYLFGRHDL